LGLGALHVPADVMRLAISTDTGEGSDRPHARTAQPDRAAAPRASLLSLVPFCCHAIHGTVLVNTIRTLFGRRGTVVEWPHWSETLIQWGLFTSGYLLFARWRLFPKPCVARSSRAGGTVNLLVRRISGGVGTKRYDVRTGAAPHQAGTGT
jgi:hypothetical protein